MRRETILQVAFAALLGILAVVEWQLRPPQALPQTVWLFSFLVLAGFCSWFEIPIEPYGRLNLSPVAIVVIASADGIAVALLVAALAPVAGLLIRRMLGSVDGTLSRLAAGGETALAVWLAGLLTGFPLGPEIIRLEDLMTLSVAAFLLLFGLTAIRIASLEGISLRRLVSPLGRRVFPHLIPMLLATPIVWLAFWLIGPPGIILSVVVMIEFYYPWKLLGEQRELFQKSLQMFSNAVDVKDPYTAHHSKRVAAYSVKIARLLGASEDEVNRIRIGALMHDIGKIAVPGNLIRKPAKLTDEEMTIMRGHVGAGTSLVEGLELIEDAKDIIQHHHENFDGTGYPLGVAGKRIPLGSRIVFVSDAYDALTTDRPYRKRKTHSEAMAVLDANAGTQFDPEVIESLKKVLGDG